MMKERKWLNIVLLVLLIILLSLVLIGVIVLGFVFWIEYQHPDIPIVDDPEFSRMWADNESPIRTIDNPFVKQGSRGRLLVSIYNTDAPNGTFEFLQGPDTGCYNSSDLTVTCLEVQLYIPLEEYRTYECLIEADENSRIGDHLCVVKAVPLNSFPGSNLSKSFTIEVVQP